MKRLFNTLQLFGLLLLCTIVVLPLRSAFGANPQPKKKPQQAISDDRRNDPLKGWDYVVSRMAEEGLNPIVLARIFADPRMPYLDTIHFSLNPKESKHLYRGHINKKRIANAMRFYERNRFFFRQAANHYGVPESVILSILQVETYCGGYTGKSRILYHLARLASAGSPHVIEANYKAKKTSQKGLRYEDVEARAKVLENTFLPHAIAALLYAFERGVDPLELEGSMSGAMGLPQFLPANLYYYGEDGDSDGQVNLFTPGDAVFSVANYLQIHGWKDKISSKDQQAVIWQYNHSHAYIETVLNLGKVLDKEITQLNKRNPSLILVQASGRLIRDTLGLSLSLSIAK